MVAPRFSSRPPGADSRPADRVAPRHGVALVALVVFWLALPVAGGLALTSPSVALATAGVAVASLIVAILLGSA